ncbi:hypothetical protein BC629DRAFT_1598019 [Irpex lacteus]|nr:hypothetical protein BC629DRAFT_1598019 [Irpex lacteus]
MPEPELDAIHKVGREKHRGPLGESPEGHRRDGGDGWDIVNFLHFLSWNLDIPPDLMHELSVIKYARTSLMICPQLAGILAHWLKPPRTRAKARDEDVLANFYSPPAEVTEEMLLNTHLKDDIKLSKELMPTFWETMTTLARTLVKSGLGNTKTTSR